jgi:hypothetical protein
MYRKPVVAMAAFADLYELNIEDPKSQLGRFVSFLGAGSVQPDSIFSE